MTQAGLELNKPFFARDHTKRMIDKAAELFPGVSIFAGAGVSIDRTGMTWDALVVHLLVKTRLPQDIAISLVRALGPRRAGSIVAERYRDLRGKGAYKAIGRELANVLYGSRDWLAGRLSKSIAGLWVDSAIAGKPSHVYTTNFEEHVRLDISKESRVLTAKALQKGRTLPALPEAKDFIVHLHGRVRENGVVAARPVISEQDYFESQAQTERILTEAFAESDLLIVGSGLDDQPMLNALLRTIEQKTRSSRRRFALVPRRDIGATDESNASKKTIQSVEQRLEHFGVEGVYVDHFSQSAQFVAELRVASRIAESYLKSDEHYGSRLTRWWTRWDAENNKDEQTYQAAQAKHHEELTKALADIRQELSASGEHLRVELWLRWDPPHLRILRLWASSFARFTHAEQTRKAIVEMNSPYAAVEAFCRGRVVYWPEQEHDALGGGGRGLNPGDPQDRRWRTHVAIPLEAAGDFNLVVGSVVVASMEDPDDSCLSELRRGDHEEALRIAAETGRRLAGVD